MSCTTWLRTAKGAFSGAKRTVAYTQHTHPHTHTHTHTHTPLSLDKGLPVLLLYATECPSLDHDDLYSEGYKQGSIHSQPQGSGLNTKLCTFGKRGVPCNRYIHTYSDKWLICQNVYYVTNLVNKLKTIVLHYCLKQIG